MRRQLYTLEMVHAALFGAQVVFAVVAYASYDQSPWAFIMVSAAVFSAIVFGSNLHRGPQ